MDKRKHIFRSLVFVLLTLTATLVMADRQNTRSLARDSLSVDAPRWNEVPSTRMAQSLYPVELKVKGRSLRVISKYEQILPIYTKGGTLYLAMQLNPGVNWLSGLPRGRYRINNRTINIK